MSTGLATLKTETDPAVGVNLPLKQYLRTIVM
jgi:hypothetical protein